MHGAMRIEAQRKNDGSWTLVDLNTNPNDDYGGPLDYLELPRMSETTARRLADAMNNGGITDEHVWRIGASGFGLSDEVGAILVEEGIAPSGPDGAELIAMRLLEHVAKQVSGWSSVVAEHVLKAPDFKTVPYASPRTVLAAIQPQDQDREDVQASFSEWHAQLDPHARESRGRLEWIVWRLAVAIIEHRRRWRLPGERTSGIGGGMAITTSFPAEVADMVLRYGHECWRLGLAEADADY